MTKIKQNVSVTRNFSYNFIYQIIAILTPLIITPYISRVLNPEGIGAFSYTQSLGSYFSLFSIIGTDIYGQREIAYCRDDKIKRTQVFWEIYTIRFIGTTITTVFYIFFLFQFDGINRTLLLFETIGLCGNVFNIVFLMQGVEAFKILFIRNLIARITSVACIFIFVKNENDLIAYVIISVAVVVVGNLTLWFNLNNYIDKPQLKKLNLLRHIKPSIALFLPTIALRLYDAFDKSMMGTLLENTIESGYYEQAWKIVTICVTAVTSLGTVVLPRIASLYSLNDKIKIREYIYKSFDVVWFLAIPMALGIFGISDNMVPWFFGDKFARVSELLKYFSIICIPIGLKNVLGIQYLIPTMHQRQYTISIVSGLLVNICLNIYMIPLYGALGAIIASVVSEITIVIIQFYMVRKDINVKASLVLASKKLFSGAGMLISLLLISRNLSPSILNTFLLICIGAVLYIVMLIILKDTMVYEVIQKVKKSLFHK